MKKIIHPKGRLGKKWVSWWAENPKGRPGQKLRIKAYEYVMASRHLSTRRFVNYPHRCLLPLNWGNNELSKRSNCSVHQGTKIGSAERRNQDILTPHRVSKQVNVLSPSRVILSALRKLSIIQQISTFLSSIYEYT